MSKFLMEGDLSILHYQALPSYATLLPNVLFDYLAAGRPVIAAMPDGETSRVLRQSKAGMVVPPENVMAIVEAISWFYEHPRQGLKMGVQAYNFAARNFDRRQLVNRLLVLFPRAIPQPVGTSRDSGINADIRIANLP
jgi:glycosyltransferase involved in cell wall biosynthesis